MITSVIAGTLWLVQAAGALEVEVMRLDGEVVCGRLVEVVPRVVLENGEGGAALAWADILSLRPLGLSAPGESGATAPWRFGLADGSAFSGRITGATDRGLLVQLLDDQVCRLELAALCSIVATKTSEEARRKLSDVDGQRADASVPAPPTAAAADVAVVAREKDVVVLRGRARRITADNIVFAWNEREMRLPWTRVAGLMLARAAPRTASAAVRLHGGDVFAGRIVAGNQESVTVQSSVWDGLVLPWSRVERIDCRSDRLVFLSELPPAHFEFEPFFDKVWDFALDKTLSGKPIRLGGRDYARGVVMHSRSRLVYSLDGRFQAFAAVAGVLDEVAPRGCVHMRVSGDGRVLWEAQGIRGGQEPRDVTVSITGVRELVLEVDYDEELDLADHACWAFARLIR